MWSFDKKRNSTKIPEESAGRVFNGELKQEFTITGLEVTFNLGKELYAPTYNYAYIPNLRRYYFITDWYYEAGLWVAVCAVDVLATFKTEIGNSIQYVTRAYSDWDPNIIDTAYITRAEGIVRDNDVLSPDLFWGASAWSDSGTVVIGVVGANASSIGAVTYYAMAMSTFGAFMDSMLSGISWANISASEISEELQKALINPTQYIVSCKWFPILFSSFHQGAITYQIELGWWSFPLIASAQVLSTVSSAWISRESYLTIPHNPQSRTNPRLAYLDLAPYSSYMLKFLPFGIFQLDTTELYDKTYLGMRVESNLMTGDSVLKLSTSGALGGFNWENSFLVTEGQIGVTIPVGQIAADIGKYKNALIAGGSTAIAEIIDRT
ncbi:MAG: hypothetical protein J6V49_02885 [Bacteroidales bacterium]|nr:hypothetical protein [Bacteroidales bacterium]MBP5709898.1 hypothetical protein [Bacteroidales bacterium]